MARAYPVITRRSFCPKVDLRLRSDVEHQNPLLPLSIAGRPFLKADLQGWSFWENLLGKSLARSSNQGSINFRCKSGVVSGMILQRNLAAEFQHNWKPKFIV